MSSTHSYDHEGFLSEFFPDADDRAQVEGGAQALIGVSRAHRLADAKTPATDTGARSAFRPPRGARPTPVS